MKGLYEPIHRRLWRATLLTILAVPKLALAEPSTATRSLPNGYVPEVGSTVAVNVQPDPSVASYAIQETPPQGWAISAISDGGIDANGTIRWFFLDHQGRVLSYQVVPAPGANGRVCFEGIASFDGSSVSIGGDDCICEFTALPPMTETGLCHDGVDNDCDGMSDCDDEDCTPIPDCERPAFVLEKTTNDKDADLPPGLTLTVGDEVRWSYMVSNTGNVLLQAIEVTDDREGLIPCPQASLAVGQSMVCSHSGIVVDGFYKNNAAVTGRSPAGTAVLATDASHYTGRIPTGACCLPDQCTIRTEEECDLEEGFFRGPDSTCDAPCPCLCPVDSNAVDRLNDDNTLESDPARVRLLCPQIVDDAIDIANTHPQLPVDEVVNPLWDTAAADRVEGIDPASENDLHADLNAPPPGPFGPQKPAFPEGFNFANANVLELTTCSDEGPGRVVAFDGEEVVVYLRQHCLLRQGRDRHGNPVLDSSGRQITAPLCVAGYEVWIEFDTRLLELVDVNARPKANDDSCVFTDSPFQSGVAIVKDNVQGRGFAGAAVNVGGGACPNANDAVLAIFTFRVKNASCEDAFVRFDEDHVFGQIVDSEHDSAIRWLRDVLTPDGDPIYANLKDRVHLTVATPGCCGNAICESEIGEDACACPQDCLGPDTDGDGIPDCLDNCVVDSNPTQDDDDNDGIGNACDDSDGDGVIDAEDACPGFDDSIDSDADGVPNGCDLCMGNDATSDTDGDGVCDDLDTCPGFDDLADADGDGTANGCDPDADNDELLNEDDNCILTPNRDQRNTDGDAFGNACDPDVNGDCHVNRADHDEFVKQFGLEADDLDLNGDGIVGMSDFAAAMAFFGGSPGPSAFGHCDP